MSEETQDEKNKETSEESSTEEELEVEETESEESDEEIEEKDSKPKSDLEVRLQELSDDNRRQKVLLEQIMLFGGGNGNTQGVVTQEKEEDDSDLDPAVAKRLNKMQKQLTQQLQKNQGMFGGVLEEMDKTAILSSPQASLYKKYQQEVESYRQQMYAQGRFFKRGEALANVLLDKGFIGMEKPKPKKLVKQKVKPVGETQKAAPTKDKSNQPKTLKEKLAGKSF